MAHCQSWIDVFVVPPLAIGVGTADWFRPPLPPNRTGGFPASGSPVDGFTSVRIDRPRHGRLVRLNSPCSAKKAFGQR